MPDEPVATTPVESTEPETLEPKKEVFEVDKETHTLIQLLKDPNSAPRVLTALGKRYGLELAGKPKEEKVETVLDMVKKELGDDFDLIPARTWGAIEKIVDAKVGKISERIGKSDEERVERESIEATEWLYSKHSDAKQLEGNIIELLDRYDIKSGMSQREFLEDMYNLAKAKKTKAGISERLAEKVGKKSTNLAGGVSRKSVV